MFVTLQITMTMCCEAEGYKYSRTCLQVVYYTGGHLRQCLLYKYQGHQNEVLIYDQCQNQWRKGFRESHEFCTPIDLIPPRVVG